MLRLYYVKFLLESCRNQDTSSGTQPVMAASIKLWSQIIVLTECRLTQSTQWSRSDDKSLRVMALDEFRILGWWQGRRDRVFRSGVVSEAEDHSKAPSRRCTPQRQSSVACVLSRSGPV